MRSVKRKAGVESMGGLRWPFRPFQVTCLLVALLPAAAFSPRRVFTAIATSSRHCCQPDIAGECMFAGMMGLVGCAIGRSSI